MKSANLQVIIHSNTVTGRTLMLCLLDGRKSKFLSSGRRLDILIDVVMCAVEVLAQSLQDNKVCLNNGDGKQRSTNTFMFSGTFRYKK